MPSLSSDVVGRIKRLPLKPSANSALMPLFEAVSNSLHAVQDRFGDDAPERGTIEIEVQRKSGGVDDGQVSGFMIKDNGVGLTEENFESFRRPDSQHKIGRGGKGIGRLGWLKVFSNIEVESHFQAGGAISSRVFDFVLAPEEQIRLKDGRPPGADPGKDHIARVRYRIRFSVSYSMANNCGAAYWAFLAAVCFRVGAFYQLP